MTDAAPSAPLRSPLHSRHEAAGAVPTFEGGWEMPARFGDPAGECLALRRRAAVMDISHLGRIRIRGDGALDLLERLCTADVAHQEDDTAAATLLLDEQGNVLDYVVLARLEGLWLLTCSPSRRPGVLEHLQGHAGRFGAKVDDQTLKTGMLAVIGPGGPAVLDAILPRRASDLPRGAARMGSMLVARYVALRVGPTRLWSLEVVLPKMLTGRAWQFITRKAGPNALPAAGLAAREVLRIEAGLCRPGREIHHVADCFPAGLDGVICFGKDFLGAPAARAARDAAPGERRIGLLLAPGPAVPQGGEAICRDGEPVGRVTSAAADPAAGRTVALGRVRVDAACPGAAVTVRTARGERVEGTLSPLPLPPP